MARRTTPPPPSDRPVDEDAPTHHDWLARLATRVDPGTGRDTSLVRLIIQAVAQAIEQGELRPGTRLPSVRALASHLRISTFTVAEAYAELAARHRVAARRGAGYFVQSQRLARAGPAPDLSPPSQVSDDWLSLNMFAQGRDLLAAGCGWLPLSWYGENHFHAALRQATRIAGEHLASYGHPLGYAGLRQQLAGDLSERLGPVHADQIVLTHGVTHALELVMMGLLQPGDAVLVEEPGYWNLNAQLRCHGLQPIGVPRSAQGLDLVTLERLALAHRPKALFVTTVGHNPLSTTLSLNQAHKLLAAAERHDLWVIEDDIFRDLDGPRAPSLGGLDGLQRVLTIGGFSKTIAPAIRVGYIASPAALVQPLARVKMACGLTTSEINERAAARVLADPAHRRYLARIRHRLAATRERVVDALEGIGLTPLALPDSGLYVCAGWRGEPTGKHQARTVAQAALQEGIALAPGDFFMLDQAPTTWFRFNVAHADDARLLDFLRRAVAPAIEGGSKKTA
ncbi:MAG: PLP-dependent aminotransferase family protein [Rubrivivax sp.]|nr:MAG: PLP-dependent aminotransferase family protein [Rubrivivax sp.]